MTVLKCIGWVAAAMFWMAAEIAAANAAAPVTLESLLREMTDRDAVARFPSPAYTCAQSSSYDRDAVSPRNQDTWYANADRSQFVRIEEKDGRREFVMHDADGPGAIVRFWATWHGPGGGPFSNGTLRIYIDGAETPTIEGTIQQVLDEGLLADGPLSEGVAPQTEYEKRGHNLYLPIPYAKHCKVTYSTDVPLDIGARHGEALYYQINYRTYPEEVEVESFSMERLAAARASVGAANAALAQGEPAPDAEWRTETTSGEIAPGGELKFDRIEGLAAIRSLRVRLEAGDAPQALRSTVVEISFDGERTVWVPLGEFFGMGYKLHPFQTWYTGADEDGTLHASWVMPFRSGAEIRLLNLGDQPVRVAAAEVRIGEWKWDDRSMHFHAGWRQWTDLATRRQTPAFDVNFVTVRGKGVYVGDTLTLFNRGTSWWGEGDEKIWVDNESFPSHFGTGSEDYYGYAWGRVETFSSAFHAQPDGSGNQAPGYTVNNRFRALDAIPFERSLRFEMEMWHSADTTIDFAPTTFWYAIPGSASNIEPAPVDAALPVAR